MRRQSDKKKTKISRTTLDACHLHITIKLTIPLNSHYAPTLIQHRIRYTRRCPQFQTDLQSDFLLISLLSRIQVQTRLCLISCPSICFVLCSFGVAPLDIVPIDQRPNSWKYYFVEVSGQNLENSVYNVYITKQFQTTQRGGGSKIR